MTRGDRRRSTMIHENNKSVVATFYNRCMSQGDIAAVSEIMAPDFVNRSSGLAGVVDVERFVVGSRQRWMTLAFTIDDIIAEGDRVAVRWTGRGTPRRGQEASWTGMGFYRLRDGKIVEHWASSDPLGLRQQLGDRPAGE